MPHFKTFRQYTRQPVRNFVVLATLLVATGCATTGDHQHARRGTIENAQRILFIGDSITWDGRYVSDVDAWLTASAKGHRDPVINVGLPSETVSGLTEPGHAGGQFVRPHLDERLGRVLNGTKPDLVIACYGMNCGIYQPFDEERFAKYRDGITHLHDEVTRMGARIVLITPPVYDATRTSNGDPHYDDVLQRYGDWLVSQRKHGWKVIDLHAAMGDEITKRRATQPDFTFSPDGVHPDEAGHWFMARQIIAYFGGKKAAVATTAEEMPGLAPGTLALVRDRMAVVRDGTLTATGHKHPAMPIGLPMDQVQSKVSALNAKIEALYSTR